MEILRQIENIDIRHPIIQKKLLYLYFNSIVHILYMKKYTLLTLLLIAMVTNISCDNQQPPQNNDYNSAQTIRDMEAAYDDIIDLVVQGYKNHWDEIATETLSVSSVFKYCPPSAGFAKTDINGDGIKELLLGDYFIDNGGQYLIYDIYTIKPDNGEIIHLLHGGERDHFTIDKKGNIEERGSNSAEDSFIKHYSIQRSSLKEYKREPFSDEEIMEITISPFYAMAK